jgi:hypothetical protein
LTVPAVNAPVLTWMNRIDRKKANTVYRFMARTGYGIMLLGRPEPAFVIFLFCPQLLVGGKPPSRKVAA